MSETLKGRHAISAGTLEEFEERGKWVVRWKQSTGVSHEKKFASVDESHTYFLECVEAQRLAMKMFPPGRPFEH